MEYYLLEFIKYLFPSLLLVFAVWIILRMFFKRDEAGRKATMEASDRKQLVKLKNTNAEMVTPVQLQAYERIILLLERITPDNLVMRLRKPGTGVGEMQGLLLQSIRDEFDHNMSQQLYVSDEAWELVKKAKEEVIQLINNTGASMKPDHSGIDLCRKILENNAAEENYPTLIAIKSLKSEIRKLF